MAPTPRRPDDLLTLAEVAQELGLNVSIAGKWHRDGRLHSVRMPTLFRRSEVERLRPQAAQAAKRRTGKTPIKAGEAVSYTIQYVRKRTDKSMPVIARMIANGELVATGDGRITADSAIPFFKPPRRK